MSLSCYLLQFLYYFSSPVWCKYSVPSFITHLLPKGNAESPLTLHSLLLELDTFWGVLLCYATENCFAVQLFVASV